MAQQKQPDGSKKYHSFLHALRTIPREEVRPLPPPSRAPTCRSSTSSNPKPGMADSSAVAEIPPMQVFSYQIAGDCNRAGSPRSRLAPAASALCRTVRSICFCAKSTEAPLGTAHLPWRMLRARQLCCLPSVRALLSLGRWGIWENPSPDELRGEDPRLT